MVARQIQRIEGELSQVAENRRRPVGARDRQPRNRHRVEAFSDSEHSAAVVVIQFGRGVIPAGVDGQ